MQENLSRRFQECKVTPGQVNHQILGFWDCFLHVDSGWLAPRNGPRKPEATHPHREPVEDEAPSINDAPHLRQASARMRPITTCTSSDGAARRSEVLSGTIPTPGAHVTPQFGTMPIEHHLYHHAADICVIKLCICSNKTPSLTGAP